jgi:hypothetical protein
MVSLAAKLIQTTPATISPANAAFTNSSPAGVAIPFRANPIAVVAVCSSKTPPYANAAAPNPPPRKFPARTISQCRNNVGTDASRSSVSATGGSVFSVYSW